LTLPFSTEKIREGKANIIVPKISEMLELAPSKTPVFYNPRMKINRDIAVIVLNAFNDVLNNDLMIGEPMTGCGVRGIRCALEVKDVHSILLNDINPKAAKLTRINIEENSVSKQVKIENMDANLFLNLHSKPKRLFNYIDVDPFGTPTPFIDSAIRAIRNNGLIALTATDMAPLCGVHPKACLRKYLGKPLRVEYCHELAVRLLIGSLVFQAAKYDFGIDILFSHSTDHYIRGYGQVRRGAKEADKTLSKMGYVLHCFNCFNRKTAPYTPTFNNLKCEECGNEYSVAGPLWIGSLFEEEFVKKMSKEYTHLNHLHSKRLTRLLKEVEEELNEPPTYFVIDKITDKLGISVPPVKKVLQKIRSKGFTATPTHFNPRGIRTNASSKLVKKAIKECV
jgi:tRNA (guanine26-N2/guanine27-N2)-dimethyltransferase